ncbi:hypothetical protein DFH06DRAFT_1313242 [Mycena polygramma]|nr:hypothetical protein DFH06DRAFT_1313242 [Mycena polygramma]
MSPPTQFTLPSRGRYHRLDNVDVVDLLVEEYYLAADARNTRVRAALHTDSDSDDDDRSMPSVLLDSTSDSESGSCYIPSDCSDCDETALDRDSDAVSVSSMSTSSSTSSEGVLPVLAVGSFPDTFRRLHLESLQFRFIRWDEQAGPLIDAYNRLALVYIGCPVESVDWQRCIINAGHTMVDARDYLKATGFNSDALSDGIQCTGPAGRRAQRVRGHEPVSTPDVVRTVLRESESIKRIVSFQNEVLKKSAPRAWKSSSKIIERVLEHDVRLRVPFSQPSAFSRVEYRFTTHGTPRRETSYIPSMTALTAVGNYDGSDEGEIIIWPDKSVINFPVGATILLPSWLPYSFTEVPWPGWQMVVAQTSEHALADQPGIGRRRKKEEASVERSGYSSLAAMDRAPRLPDGAIANTVRPLGSTPDNPFLVDENGHFGLTRSTAENPFLVDENGEFVRSLSGALKRSPSHGRSPVKRSPSARPYRMYGAPNGGPPSIIRQDIPRRRMRRSQTTDRPYLRALALAGHPLPPTFATPAPGDASGSTSAAGTSTGAASAQKPVKKSLFRSSGATPLRLRKRKTPRQGFRTPRDTPFNVKDLYLTDARPPADSDPLPHHECSVCYNIKSHPVAYRCGHSHCYVCVREWLETSWECPFCRAEIRDEPMCSDDAKRAIAFDHPDWQDHSLVSYSWEGLYFPDQIKKRQLGATLLQALTTPQLQQSRIVARERSRADANVRLHNELRSCLQPNYQLSLRSLQRDGGPSDRREGAKAAAAKYRERNREQIRAADRVRRAKRYIESHGLEAFDEKEDRAHMSKTQKLHEGQSVPARPRPPLRKRFNPAEILTENQRRCRALRSCGLEDDNGADSDEDLPRGMCGCDKTECQLLHKNESADRKEWKLFHIKYRQELEHGF